MLIDWFTVGAQIINFLILVWLLKRFLYKPILSAMDERERIIADNLKNAAVAKAEAENERSLFQQKNRNFEYQRNDMLKTIQEQVDQEYQTLIEQARSQVKKKQAEWEQTLIDERKVFLEELKTHVQQEVLAITRQFLADLAEADLERRMIAVFINRLQEASGDVKSTITEFIRKTAGSVVVRSAFDLPEEVKTEFGKALGTVAEADLTVVFERSDAVMCGIELIADGRKVSWTMAKYLSVVQQDVEEFIERKKAGNVAGK